MVAFFCDDGFRFLFLTVFLADSSSPSSPGLSHSGSVPLAANPAYAAPAKAVSAAEENDPNMRVFMMDKNISFAMKQREYCERLGKALKVCVYVFVVLVLMFADEYSHCGASYGSVRN
jgi:hypothetical protein